MAAKMTGGCSASDAHQASTYITAFAHHRTKQKNERGMEDRANEHKSSKRSGPRSLASHPPRTRSSPPSPPPGTVAHRWRPEAVGGERRGHYFRVPEHHSAYPKQQPYYYDDRDFPFSHYTGPGARGMCQGEIGRGRAERRGCIGGVRGREAGEGKEGGDGRGLPPMWSRQSYHQRYSSSPIPGPRDPEGNLASTSPAAGGCGGFNEMDRGGRVGGNDPRGPYFHHPDRREHGDGDGEGRGKRTLPPPPPRPFRVPYDDRIPPPPIGRPSASVAVAGGGGGGVHHSFARPPARSREVHPPGDLNLSGAVQREKHSPGTRNDLRNSGGSVVDRHLPLRSTSSEDRSSKMRQAVVDVGEVTPIDGGQKPFCEVVIDSSGMTRLYIPKHPPMVPRRPTSKGNKRETMNDIAHRIPVSVIRPYFNYSLRKAAEAMNISVTTLKRLCRRYGVKRWPHRQINRINRAMSNLEFHQDQVARCNGNGQLNTRVSDQMQELLRRRSAVIEHAFESDDGENISRGRNSSDSNEEVMDREAYTTGDVIEPQIGETMEQPIEINDQHSGGVAHGRARCSASSHSSGRAPSRQMLPPPSRPPRSLPERHISPSMPSADRRLATPPPMPKRQQRQQPEDEERYAKKRKAGGARISIAPR